MKKIISVLIPVYNVEKYILRCATSLLNQSDSKDVEFIFVNDCTKDNSINILNEFIEKHYLDKKQWKLIHHQKNKGLAGARNTGIDSASGEYILLLDSDDTLEPETLAVLKKTIEKRPSDIVVFGMKFVYNDGKSKTVGGNYVPTSKQDYLQDVISRNCLVTACGKLYSRHLFEKVRFIEGLNFGEDYATLPRLIHSATEIVDLSDQIFYNYYQDNLASYTKSVIGRKQIDNIYNAISLLVDYFNNSLESANIEEILKIRNKIFLLEYVDKPFRKEILNRFEEYNDKKVELPLKHKIVWELARRRHDKLLSGYLDFSQWIKSKLHI